MWLSVLRGLKVQSWEIYSTIFLQPEMHFLFTDSANVRPAVLNIIFTLRHLLHKFVENVAMAKAVKKYSKSDPLSGLNEYAMPYGANPDTANLSSIIRWLGFPGSAAKKMVSNFDFINLGISGITKGAVNTLASHLGISRKYISENIFDISVKTFERKEDKARLDKKVSSHALEIARVVQHAFEVFRDKEKVKRWLNSQNRALNNFKPVELLDTLTGINMVNDILGRIEEGVYS